MIIHKIRKILSSNQKKIIPLILFLLIFSMLLETLSIGLIFPLLELTFKEGNSFNLTFISEIFYYFKSILNIELIPLVCLSLLFILIIKSIFLIYIYNFLARFASSILTEQSKIFFNLYINQSWKYHSNKNSSIFIRNILSEVGNFMGFTEASIIIIAESFIILGIMILLLFIDFQITILTFLTILILSIIFNLVSKKYLIEWGNKRHYNDSFRIKYLNEAFASIKEIKIFQKESFFVDKFNFHNVIVAKIRQYRKVFSQLPRIFLEFIIISIIILIVFFFYFLNLDLTQNLPKLGIFFASFLRIMPSTNKIMHAYQTFKFNKKSIDNLYYDYVNLRIQNTEIGEELTFEFNNIIEIINLKFRYDDNQEFIFNNLNLKIDCRSCVGLTGKTGEGKTTFIDLLLGIIKPIEGSINVDNNNINKKLSSWKSIIGYVPQSVFLMDDSISANIAFGIQKNNIDFNKINKSIEMSELKDFIDHLELGLETNIGENGVKLSGGQKQRIGIARALYNNPEFIIFDESTSSLDEQTEKSIVETISKLKKKKTMLIISHKNSVVSLCDKIYKLEKGAFKII